MKGGVRHLSAPVSPKNTGIGVAPPDESRSLRLAGGHRATKKVNRSEANDTSRLDAKRAMMPLQGPDREIAPSHRRGGQRSDPSVLVLLHERSERTRSGGELPASTNELSDDDEPGA